MSTASPVVAVMSCWKYRDAWRPFFELFHKFWPDCPYDVYLITDHVDLGYEFLPEPPSDGRTYVGRKKTHLGGKGITWGDLLSGFCEQHPDSPILFMQEDFFLTAPIRQDLIQSGLEVLQFFPDGGCVRLYPCPGGDAPFDDNPNFGFVALDAPYRVSCQAAWWQPEFLRHLAKKFQDAWAIETMGTAYTRRIACPPILAWRREVTPWPLEYFCTGIVRGLWHPGALELFKEHGIEIDRSTNRQTLKVEG